MENPRYLITPSLHSSWHFYNLLDSKTKQDFLDTLCKKSIERTEAMQDGVTFEDDIRAVAEGRSHAASHRFLNDKDYGRCVLDVVERVRGGIWQQSVQKEITLKGMSFLLYGKTDVLLRNTIKDIKFTGKYEVGKFIDSVQHKLYLFCEPTIPNFEYIASDGESVWVESYHMTPTLERELMGELATMIGHIMADKDFSAAFIANWKTKY